MRFERSLRLGLTFCLLAPPAVIASAATAEELPVPAAPASEGATVEIGVVTGATDTKAHPRAKDFPGEVPQDAPRVTRTIKLGPQKAVAGPSRSFRARRLSKWHSTGLYAAPGQTITLTVPEDALDKGLQVRIGCHKDRLRDSKRREPVITTSDPLAEATGTAANQFGGSIYIDVPQNVDLRPISIKIEGAVLAPHFILGQTRLEDWRSEIRNRPAPWAELETRKIVLSVPSAVIRDLDDPRSLMEFWDGVMDAQAALAMIPTKRARPGRMVADIQISAGYMHAGYPIMMQLRSAKVLTNLEQLKNNAHGDVWGFFHELGHNHQDYAWTFRGASEVTCNLFTLYCMEKLCHNQNPRREVSKKFRQSRIRRHIEGGADFNAWMRDPFLALQMYMQLQEAFGWEAFQKVFAEYRELPRDQRPRSDDDKRDQWLVRFSKTAGKNLGPFFEGWGVPTSKEARESIADLPTWMPDDFPPGAEGK